VKKFLAFAGTQRLIAVFTRNYNMYFLLSVFFLIPADTQMMNC